VDGGGKVAQLEVHAGAEIRPRQEREALTHLRPRLLHGRVADYASRFDASGDERIERIVPSIRRRGYLTRGELIAICRWKSPRAIRRVEGNSPSRIRRATSRALSAKDELGRIEPLLGLDGVGWPTASVILHFCHPDPTPILDVRALWSLGLRGRPRFGPALWIASGRAARTLAERAGCSMRTLDRALWQYSKERQRGGRRAGFVLRLPS
jgi:hypothetical protein